MDELDERKEIETLVNNQVYGSTFDKIVIEAMRLCSLGVLVQKRTDVYIGPGQFLIGPVPGMSDEEKQMHFVERDGLVQILSLVEDEAVANVYLGWLGFTGGNARAYSYQLNKKGDAWSITQRNLTGMT
ncbi:hypothetical protein HYZ97_02735 [Candidatus Pacearchaeota archaeon]|nr:hypothetical protein [Candidatus Pacearchaeota archaeon]